MNKSSPTQLPLPSHLPSRIPQSGTRRDPYPSADVVAPRDDAAPAMAVGKDATLIDDDGDDADGRETPRAAAAGVAAPASPSVHLEAVPASPLAKTTGYSTSTKESAAKAEALAGGGLTDLRI